ncbi:histone-lysine N-methyltransferase SETMAR [Trichonephila clavipes]|nr:histone-lysine N-methyltransferase SETMAR [Trichonephila clavipes]
MYFQSDDASDDELKTTVQESLSNVGRDFFIEGIEKPVPCNRYLNKGDDLVNAVDEKIREDRRFTISTLALEFPNVGRTTLHKVVSEKLKFRKLCAHWVPRLLTEEHKLKRMACALDFLDRYHKEGDQFLERIVTEDET